MHSSFFIFENWKAFHAFLQIIRRNDQIRLIMKSVYSLTQHAQNPPTTFHIRLLQKCFRAKVCVKKVRQRDSNTHVSQKLFWQFLKLLSIFEAFKLKGHHMHVQLNSCHEYFVSLEKNIIQNLLLIGSS